MPNVTLSMDAELLSRSREYARRHHTTLNAMVRQLVKKTVVEEDGGWVDECFRKMDQGGGHSSGKKWSREELYDV